MSLLSLTVCDLFFDPLNSDSFATRLRPGGLGGALRATDADKAITLAGWVHRVRNLGGLVFLDLRDRAGLLQVSFNPDWTPPDVLESATALGQEFVVQVSGTVVLRPQEMRNAEIGTGEIELRAT